MATRQIIRGDDYYFFWRLTFIDKDGNPLNLSDTTVRTTYKTAVTDPNTDTTDATAVAKHFITIDAGGAVTDSDGMRLGDSGLADDGILYEAMSNVETLGFDLDTEYISDVELTDDDGFVTTFLYLDDPIVAIDGVTNRTVD